MTDFLHGLIEAATRADGQPPFSDQSLVDHSAGTRSLLSVGAPEPLAAALVTVSREPTEAELVVHPDARRQGFGERLLLDVVAAAGGELLVWAHGDHPGARALAARHGFEPVRELLQMRAAVPPSTSPASGVVRPFRPSIDDTAWLELNALAFAEHPEQGKLAQRDLDVRMAEAWFDPADLLMLWDDEQLIGFCWLKVDGPIGEFYAVGVHPGRQGEGVGRMLVEAGLNRLAVRGIRVSNLYVEADNEPAVRLYRAYGFHNHTVDIQYRLAG